jgi:hypothetical protein
MGGCPDLLGLERSSVTVYRRRSPIRIVSLSHFSGNVAERYDERYARPFTVSTAIQSVFSIIRLRQAIEISDSSYAETPKEREGGSDAESIP